MWLYEGDGTLRLFDRVRSQVNVAVPGWWNTGIVWQGPFVGRAFPNSTMVGIGLTMEGINQNDVIYEFMSENIWRNQPRDINQW